MYFRSENRRHFQLTHPAATGEALDNMMRVSWEQLGNREKLKYVQRASNALKDRNKHSYNPSYHHHHHQTRFTQNVSTKLADGPSCSNTPTEEEQFCALPGDTQWKILEDKLQYFKSILTPEEYFRFTEDIKMNFRVTATRMGYTCGVFQPRGLSPYLANLSRRLLYRKVKEFTPVVEERRRKLYAMMKKEYDRRFQNLVTDVLNDETIWEKELGTASDQIISAGNVDYYKNDELGQILRDLRAIDCRETTVWSEEDKLNIKLIVKELKDPSKPAASWLEIGNTPVMVPDIANKAGERSLLQEVCSRGFLPTLTVGDVDDVTTGGSPGNKESRAQMNPAELDLADALCVKVDTPPLPKLRQKAPPPHLTFHDYVINDNYVMYPQQDESQTEEQCCEMDSASCVLTTALITERLAEQRN